MIRVVVYPCRHPWELVYLYIYLYEWLPFLDGKLVGKYTMFPWILDPMGIAISSQTSKHGVNVCVDDLYIHMYIYIYEYM